MLGVVGGDTNESVSEGRASPDVHGDVPDDVVGRLFDDVLYEVMGEGIAHQGVVFSVHRTGQSGDIVMPRGRRPALQELLK